jgi:hypothetical protein
MGLKGDFKTLDLPGLFQSLEAGRKGGLLTIDEGPGAARLYFREGRLALVAFDERAGLGDFLVAAGAVAPEALSAARKRRRGKRTLARALEEAGALPAERVSEIAAARLVDEACELLAAGWGRFEFEEGELPGEVFDADEVALELALPIGPLLLESARRMDHWKLVRERIPSDSTHYALVRPPRATGDPDKDDLLEQLTGLCDGSRSVSEVVAHLPHRRLEAYELLAELERAHAIRPADPADLNERVQELARRDPERARALLERGLEASPRSTALLATRARLAQKAGDVEDACEALRMLAHLHLEADQREDARDVLEHLKDLDPDDPFVWERSFDLALEEGRAVDAQADGARLVALYKKPGLHKKICVVLERLIEAQGETWERVRALARARAEAGDVRGAVKRLEAFGAARVAEESYPLARAVYEEILAIHPRSARARQAVAELESGELARRRARWRSIRRRVLAGFFLLVVLPWLGYEALARRSYVNVTRDVLRAGLLEERRYDEAAARFRLVRARFPWTTTSAWDVEHVLAELEAKGGASDGGGPP